MKKYLLNQEMVAEEIGDETIFYLNKLRPGQNDQYFPNNI